MRALPQLNSMVAPTTEEPSHFSLLAEDLISQILKKLDKKEDRRSFSEVCKQWYKLEGLSRSSLCVWCHRYSDGFLFASLARFPNLVRFILFAHRTGLNSELIAQTCRGVESIRVDTTSKKSCDSILGAKSLSALWNWNPLLSQVELEESNVTSSGVAALLHSAPNLKSLNISFNPRICDESLRAMGSAYGSTSKTLKELVLLNCKSITDIGGVAISAVQTLKKLILRYNEKLSDITMFALTEHFRNLEILDVSYCSVSGAGIRAFSTHKCLKSLEVLRVKSIDLSDVETIALGCPSLESKSVMVSSHLRKLEH